MILQYKGYKDNWCYEQANTIIWTKVYVGDLTRKYREGGVERTEFFKDKDTYSGQLEKAELIFARKMHESIDSYIKQETHCADDIIYLIGNCKFSEMENICVVTLRDKNKNITYVFEKGVYLLNDGGGTVQKIA